MTFILFPVLYDYAESRDKSLLNLIKQKQKRVLASANFCLIMFLVGLGCSLSMLI
jgi:hypothetical protein